MVDQDAKDVLFFFGGMVLVCTVAFLVVSGATRPSPMQVCIKAGYEWIDFDCVKGSEINEGQ
jgi:hypothetical protein